jgi:hypothetical protein
MNELEGPEFDPGWGGLFTRLTHNGLLFHGCLLEYWVLRVYHYRSDRTWSPGPGGDSFKQVNPFTGSQDFLMRDPD